MAEKKSQNTNHSAYLKLREHIRRTYPQGRFVAIAGGQIVADASDLQQLCAALRAAGVEPAEAMAVQAGVDYPEEVTILPLGSVR